MFDYFEVSKKLSNELEYEIKKNKVKARNIAEKIGMSPENFSKMRCELKIGKLPSSKFLVGCTLYFNKNFLL